MPLGFGGSAMVALRTDGSKPPVFLVAGVGARADNYLLLGERLPPDHPFYVLQNQGLENRGLPDFSITGAARRAIASIRVVQPSGPYVLAGHSWGGFVAYEIARQLSEAGHPVAFLGLLDVIDDRYRGEAGDGGPPRRVPTGNALEAQLNRLRGRMRQLGVVRRVVTAALSRHPCTPAHLVDFYRYGPILSRRYRRPPWRGPATVVTATANPENLVALDWTGILLDAPYRCSVPGDHVTMFRQPDVETLGEVMSRRIADAVGTSGRRCSPRWPAAAPSR